jgi:purine-nucleoside phosphorylase
LKVVGFSIITDECFPDALKPVDVPEVIRVANETEPRLRALIRGVIEALRKAV